MEYVKYIVVGLIVLFVGYVFLRIFAFGIAKSVIEAIQQSLQIKKNRKGEQSKWQSRKDK